MRFLAFLLFLAFVVFAIGARDYFVCELLQLCGDEPVEEVDVRLQTLQLTKGDTVLLSDYDQFAFEFGKYEPRMNANNESFLDTLAILLNADSTSNLEITGRYLDTEADLLSGFQETMGKARADAIHKLLVDRGIAEERIRIADELTTDTLLKEPLTFSFYTNTTPSEYATNSYTFTNMTYSDANFPSNSYEFDPGQAFRLYADSVKTYMDLHPEKMIRIIGHTDSDDTEKYNMKLGTRRAESARDFLQNLGVTNMIEVESMGETKPVASNKTKEGKQKNRRVNFVIETVPSDQ
jgi:outer membrane protein OmpA-like peptidoglycan-associated protein